MIVCAATAQASAAEADSQGRDSKVAPEDISEILAPLIEQHHISGMAAAVVKDAHIIATGVAGVRERGRPERLTINDRFHLGSVTKSMTATLCAMLVEEGQLRWDLTLAEALPDLKETMRPEFRNVTLAQLLNQRSGLGESVGSPEVWETFVDFSGTLMEARHACAGRVLAENPHTTPGSRFTYSNYNYLLAGHIAELVANRPWEELIRERLFAPLDMKSAGFGAPGRPEVFDEPRGHRKNGKPLEPGPKADNLPLCGPSGTVHCSLPDWAKFAAFHATEGTSHAGLLRRETFVTLHTPVKAADSEPDLEKIAAGSIGYAMGWFVFDGGCLVHTGTNTFWYAVQVVLPEQRLSVLVACNQGTNDAEAGCHEAARVLLGRFKQ